MSEKNEGEVSNGFILTLQNLGRGNSVDELSEQLQEVVESVRQTGKQGSITYKVIIKPAGRNNSEQLIVRDEISSSTPKPDREESIFWATDQNHLVRENPRQQNLNLRSLESKDDSKAPESSEKTG